MTNIAQDYAFENLWKEQGYPDYMFLDVRPASYPVILITSHDLAEQVTKSTKQQPYSTTKSKTIQTGFGRLVGKLSILTLEGEEWKATRKRFNPGFAPQHLLSLLPVLVDKTSIFVEKLNALAKSGKASEIESLCTNVTFDIIGEAVTDTDCKAQDETQSNDMVKYFKILLATYAMSGGLSFDFLNIPLQTRRWYYGKRLDEAVRTCVKQKFFAIQAGETSKQDRSVLALALKDTVTLTPTLLQNVTDQVKTFMFAGHDTTSILLQRAIYALSIHPECLRKIRAEHDAVFGSKNPATVILERPDETMKALSYTSAVIKETLRLWPPAATARMSHNGFKIRPSSGEEVCVDGCVLYLIQHLIHRDPKVYGDTADDFMPERWVGDIDTSSATVDTDGSTTGTSSIPISAWRPFERGPRNCVGQELANLEARVILSCVMRRFEFEKVGMGEMRRDEKGVPIVDAKGKCKVSEELLSVSLHFVFERVIEGG